MGNLILRDSMVSTYYLGLELELEIELEIGYFEGEWRAF